MLSPRYVRQITVGRAANAVSHPLLPKCHERSIGFSGDISGPSIEHYLGRFFMRTFMQWMAAASLLSTFSIAPASAQQQQALFCLSDGTQISAQRFETHDGKFFLYIPGSSTPLEYPVSSVKGINVRCDSGATPPPAPPSQAQNPPAQQNAAGFGIHGSNTIGERLMPMLIEA